MTINTISALTDALNADYTSVVINKSSLANQIAGRYVSLWTASGLPLTGTIPSTPVVTTSATTGAMIFPNQTSPRISYIGQVTLNPSLTGTSIEIHDRLAHMGGLSGGTTLLQTITGMNLDTLAPSADRIGAADYSDCQWWLEGYTAVGATAASATINVTYSDNSTGNLSGATVGGTGVRYPGNTTALTPLIPAAKQGLYIKGVNTIQLSASTTGTGNFGFSVTRSRSVFLLEIANKTYTFDWASLGFPSISNDSCLQLFVLPTTTSSGAIRGLCKLVHG